MEVQVNDIVRSLKGRDQGEYFVVLCTEGDFLYLANGKNRTLDAMKKKRRKHAAVLCSAQPYFTEKFNETGKITNSEIRKALAKFAGEQRIDEGGI